MQELSQVKQAIKKGQPSPVYLVLGTESALINESRRVLRSIIPPDMISMNYGRYDMQEVPLANATQELSEPPFFGDYREIVIENPDFLTGSGSTTKQEEALGELQAYVKNPSPATILVIIAPYPKLDARKKIVKAIAKAATEIDASPMTEAKSKAVIRQRAVAAKVAIDEPALDALVSRTQAEYSAMVAAMPVLLLHAAQSKTITKDDVERLVPKQLTDSVFDLVDAVLQRDADTALGIYHDLLLMKEEPLRLVSLLEGQFRLLIQLMIFKNRGYTQGAAAANLKVHPYRVKLAWRKLSGVNRTDLDAAYMLLVNTEAAMKRGTLNKELGFELFVLQYTGKRERA